MNEDPSLSIRAFADELPVAVWVGRVPGGELVYVNRAFEAILGMGPPEDAARGNYAETYSVHDRDGAPYPEHRMPYERAVAARETVVVDDLVIHRGSRRIYLRVFARPLFDAAGQMTHVVEAFIDISREVEAERARTDGEGRLAQALRMESIGQLAGGIAHDFNNLLAAIKLLARQLCEGEHDPVRLETLGHIDQATTSAAELTRALLAFAQRGKHLAQRVALNAVVASVAALGQRTIGRGIEVRCELAAADDVVGDVSQLEQVVLNLVLNARDAMAGEGQLWLRTYNRLAPGGEVTEVVLEVQDTGPGIDPAVRERIFEPYVTTKITGSVKGTGLGLATAYGVLKAHGGSIEVASTGPKGTTMRVVLPSAPPRSAEPSRPELPSLPRPQQGQGTVLVVDDEPLVREAASNALRGLGYDVLQAEDGPSAVALYRSRPPGAIDAVLLDLVMPRMSGHDTFYALREFDPHAAVLLSTGCALNDEAQRLLDAGALGFLPKPFEPEALSESIACVIAYGAAGRQL